MLQANATNRKGEDSVLLKATYPINTHTHTHTGGWCAKYKKFSQQTCVYCSTKPRQRLLLIFVFFFFKLVCSIKNLRKFISEALCCDNLLISGSHISSLQINTYTDTQTVELTQNLLDQKLEKPTIGFLSTLLTSDLLFHSTLNQILQAELFGDNGPK